MHKTAITNSKEKHFTKLNTSFTCPKDDSNQIN
jgi:hypothetical protein